MFALGGGQRSGQPQGGEKGEEGSEGEKCADGGKDAKTYALLLDCIVDKLRKDTAEKEEAQDVVPDIVQGNKEF